MDFVGNSCSKAFHTQLHCFGSMGIFGDFVERIRDHRGSKGDLVANLNFGLKRLGNAHMFIFLRCLEMFGAETSNGYGATVTDVYIYIYYTYIYIYIDI